MFIFLDFSLNTSRAIKKGGGENFKSRYVVFVLYKLESKYKKSSKFEEVMVQNQKKKSDFKWNKKKLLKLLRSEWLRSLFKLLLVDLYLGNSVFIEIICFGTTKVDCPKQCLFV
jgi:hypothetical protein